MGQVMNRNCFEPLSGCEKEIHICLLTFLSKEKKETAKKHSNSGKRLGKSFCYWARFVSPTSQPFIFLFIVWTCCRPSPANFK